jgi:hypothetical protein
MFQYRNISDTDIISIDSTANENIGELDQKTVGELIDNGLVARAFKKPLKGSEALRFKNFSWRIQLP